jgi:hypothetical protein
VEQHPEIRVVLMRNALVFKAQAASEVPLFLGRFADA